MEGYVLALFRLETLVEQWEKFETEATQLEQWLSSALKRSQHLSSLDDRELQNISAIRQKIDIFLVNISTHTHFYLTKSGKSVSHWYSL